MAKKWDWTPDRVAEDWRYIVRATEIDMRSCQLGNTFRLPESAYNHPSRREASMTPDQRLYAIGCYINSALYVIGLFVLGIALHKPWCCYLALGTAALAFLSYNAAMFNKDGQHISLTLLSLVCAIGGAVALFL